MRSHMRTVMIVAICAYLLSSSFVNIGTASAFVMMSLDGKPAAISNDTTPTFTFDGYDMDTDESYAGSVECQIDGGAFASCASPFTTPTLAAGNHTFVVHAVGDGHAGATVSHSWNINQTPTFSGGTGVSGVAGIPVAVTDLQISDADNDILGVTLSAPSGVLKLTTTSGLTFVGGQTGSTIVFSGTRTDLNTALTTLTYTPSVAGSIDIEATITGAAGGTRDTLNGHYYRVSDSTASWSTAKTAAEASTFGGVSGYLATVTSAAEKTYILNRMSDGVWIGASDIASEGNWRWAGGPENNISFWNGGAVGGAYANWQAAQPDNFSGNENCLEMRLNFSESWNDENCGSSRRYVIEYGADGALPSLDTTQVTATILAAGADLDGDGLANSVEANAPNDGDANDDGTADYTQANVSSLFSATAGGYVTVETDCTANEQVQLSTESLSQKDPAYDYPYGLASFTGTSCGVAGATVEVTQYYYGATNPAALTLRKWNSTTDTYSTIDGAVLSAVTVGAAPAVKVAYQVVDGGLLDQDSVADGDITDPVGLGRAAVVVPNTGYQDQIVQPFIYGLSGLSLVLASCYVLGRYIRKPFVDNE